MKTRLYLSLTVLLTMTISLLAGSRDEMWQNVSESVNKGMPKTAIEQLEPIIAGAITDHDYGEAIKGIARKLALEGRIQGGKPEAVVVRLQAEIEKVPVEMKPLMESILAHWYWRYFQQNRWRFLQRSQTTEAPGSDIQTWDLPRILAEIDRHFTAALADEAGLQRIAIADFDVMFIKGSVPDAYQPTLYDFIANQALLFYQAGEQGAVHVEDGFSLDAAGPIFADAATFLDWQPATTDTSSPLLKAVRLHQKLLRFHQADADQSAYHEADFSRLTFGSNSAVGDAKNDNYKTALRRFIANTDRQEISVRARAALATLMYAEGNVAEAHALAQRGFEAFPDTAGGSLCHNLIQQIEAKSAQLETEFVWNTPGPILNITYRNVTKVHFRAIRLNFEDYLRQWDWNVINFDRVFSGTMLRTQPTREWSETLPATTDFLTHTVALTAPADLAPGFYCIIASHLPDFSPVDNQLSLAPVWVSTLALVTEYREKSGTDGGFVLQAGSGEPITGAKVQGWIRLGNEWSRSGPLLTTDANGHFSTPSKPGSLIFIAQYQGQTISNHQSIWNSPHADHDDDEPTDRTIFFTDRAIYRPGQIINYKGIAYHAGSTVDAHAVLAGKTIEVIFSDTNGKEIARAKHTTNAYGSFSGSFTIPRDRNTGQMSLQVETGPEGGTQIEIEEYKRPKFQVELPAPPEAAKLGGTVSLTGKANAYTGAAIDHAKIQWRVERASRLPSWCWWWQPPSTTAIAHGDAVTALDGSFSIEFTATPDRSIPEKLEPVFTYTISVDATDSTGETRSASRQIRIGYTALQASLHAAEWQTPEKPVVIFISTSTLDGVPQSVAGTLIIHSLQQPRKVERAPLQSSPQWWSRSVVPPINPANPASWDLGASVVNRSFQCSDQGVASVSLPLAAGIYRATLETKDRFGKTVTAQSTVQVIGPSSKRCALNLPSVLTAEKWRVAPGETFQAVWGTGYDSGRAFISVEQDGEVIDSYWTAPNETQARIALPITAEMPRGITLHVMQVRENRAYLYSKPIEVSSEDRQLDLKWHRFRSKLLPGQKEAWTLEIADTKGDRQPAELVATLYDASLDQFTRLNWPEEFNLPEAAGPNGGMHFQNAQTNFSTHESSWRTNYRPVHWLYRSFNPGFFDAWWWAEPAPARSTIGDTVMHDANGEYIVLSPFCVEAASNAGYAASSTLAGTRISTVLYDVASAVSSKNGKRTEQSHNTTDLQDATGEPDLNRIVARKNLNETAFFLPHVSTNWRGIMKLKFTMPEALTEWKFMGFAHDKNLRSGFLTDKVVTAKDLMVEPNPPRFVREGDAIEFTVKVSNQSDKPQTGSVRLTFADAATLLSVDAALGNRVTEQSFDIPSKQSRTYSWRIAVPDGMGFLTYKAVGASNEVSDGEEGFLPVLSRRILVTESLPLPIRSKTTKEFDFAKLRDSGQSDSLRSQSLTVQMVSQPAWYAVMALPYLMEFPHECSEQLFSRLYANALARHIANSNPKIRGIFDLWKNTPALESPLTKNQDLKSVMIEETPWLRQANTESQSRRNLGLLFDANRLDEESARTLSQLADRQLSDGLWSWFPGGRSSEYISLTIMTGFGRLRHLGVEIDAAPAIKSLAGLDAWMSNRYRNILITAHPELYIPSESDALYLYGRSFFLKDQPLSPEHQITVDFFLRQARQHWLKVGSRLSQAHLAIALQRFGEKEAPPAIMKSLKELSVSTEELGMFWRDAESGWWWWQAPIETQAMMIEAFDEVAHDAQAVEGCKVWLLKQKQTQDWKTTRATADTIYALLLHGDNLLDSDALVEVSLGGQTIKPEKVEAGTGFYEQKFVRDEIKPAMGAITVKKVDEGVSWGSVHWQYLEDMTKVTPHEGTPLKLKKTLWVKETTNKGQVLKPVSGPLAVGDELVVRLELRTDRAMEYVHLKDQRGSGTEPVNVLSQYKYQDGLGYYESTRDTASHFYIDYLPKGVYVFEYSTRVQLKGSYQSGIAEIQCMYAPEFNSHSESFTLEVK